MLQVNPAGYQKPTQAINLRIGISIIRARLRFKWIFLISYIYEKIEENTKKIRQINKLNIALYIPYVVKIGHLPYSFHHIPSFFFKPDLTYLSSHLATLPDDHFNKKINKKEKTTSCRFIIADRQCCV